MNTLLNKMKNYDSTQIILVDISIYFLFYYYYLGYTGSFFRCELVKLMDVQIQEKTVVVDFIIL